MPENTIQQVNIVRLTVFAIIVFLNFSLFIWHYKKFWDKNRVIMYRKYFFMVLLQECNTIVFIIVTIMFPLNSSEISWYLFSAPPHYLPLPSSAYLKLLILITGRSYFATLTGQLYQDMYGCANLKNKTTQGCLILVGGGGWLFVVCLLVCFPQGQPSSTYIRNLWIYQ